MSKATASALPPEAELIFSSQGLGFFKTAVGVHDDVVAVGREALADGGADTATATGDEGAAAFAVCVHRDWASSTTEARPSSRQRSPQWRVNW